MQSAVGVHCCRASLKGPLNAEGPWTSNFSFGSAVGGDDDEEAEAEADGEGGRGVRLMEEALDILEQAQAMLSEAETKVSSRSPGPTHFELENLYMTRTP